MSEIAESKRALRTRIRAARRARSDADRSTAAGRIAANAALLLPSAPVDIACYVSMPTEPSTEVLLMAMRMAGNRVWVPRVAGEQLEWVQLADWTEWITSELGISEPTGDGVLGLPVKVNVVFIPALAVDRSGHRLGQGGGFYDRALAEVASHADGGPLRAAIVFADEVLNAVPFDAHDVIVDSIVTD